VGRRRGRRGEREKRTVGNDGVWKMWTWRQVKVLRGRGN
jgi:hypothetical protein